MENSTLRANNQSTISGPNRGTPRRQTSAFSDLPMASLAPTAQNPGDNVFGVSSVPASPAATPAAAPSAALAAPSPTDVELGSPEWQQIKLANAIEQLRKHYSQLAAQSGGSLQDPYWDAEYDKALQAEVDAISSEASGYRYNAEQAQAGRDVTQSEGAANRTVEQQIWADRIDQMERDRKSSERGAMWSGLGKFGLDALTTPYGGSPAKFSSVPFTLPPVGKPDEAGYIAGSQGYRTTETAPEVPAKTGFGNLARKTGDVLKDSFMNYNPGLNAVVPTGLGALAGTYLLPSRKGSNPWARLGAGALGGAGNIALGDSLGKYGGSASPWSNLGMSAAASWADPFNKRSWGKNTGGTLAKLGAGFLTRYI